jgi:hypothetical protein
MFQKATRGKDGWQLPNGMGHELHLPCHESYANAKLALGTLGTRRRVEVPGKVTVLMAKMLASLGCPLYLLDVRRDGTGAQSSWSPREFASVIPAHLPSGQKYAYVHIPHLAPSVELLEAKHLNWSQFRDRYIAQLSNDALSVGEAFVEAAAKEGGLGVLMCAEADHPQFDSLPEEQKETHYCHRFTLAKQIARRLQARHAGVTVSQVHLDLVDFQEADRAGRSYTPRLTVL